MKGKLFVFIGKIHIFWNSSTNEMIWAVIFPILYFLFVIIGISDWFIVE